MTLAILPCPECGGKGCQECAVNFLDQIKAKHRRHDLAERDTQALRAEAIELIAAIARRDGQQFDAEDPRVQNAILLATDILRMQREPKQVAMEMLANDGGDRWQMLEFEKPLKTAKHIECPPWRRDAYFVRHTGQNGGLNDAIIPDF